MLKCVLYVLISRAIRDETSFLEVIIVFLYRSTLSMTDCDIIAVYRVAQKSKPLPIDQNIALKPVSEIIFIRQIKV